MKKSISIVALSILTAFTSLNAVAVSHQSSKLDKKINSILTEFGQNLNIGILIEDADSGKKLYEKNSDRYFMPASNEKLFTAWAALSYLGPNFTYQTQLFVDKAKIHDGVLNDNVYLNFSGDPTLTFAQLDQLISALVQVGIKQINGHLIINDSVFDDVAMSPGTTWDDQKYCWGSPVSSLTLDHNCITATLAPAQQFNQLATLTLSSQSQSVQLINQAMTRDKDAECKLTISSTDNAYVINGCVNINATPKPLALAVKNPRNNIQAALTTLLNKYQIITQGIEFKKVDVLPTLLASANSAPVSSLISTMLKDSDNTIANSLFKKMGAIFSNGSGTWQSGHDALSDTLKKTVGLSIPTTTYIDGAGASRYNFVTPQEIMMLLRGVYAIKDHSPLFMNALPVAGVDGTIKDRMTEKNLRGNVFAKTGTETAVTALSGYLKTKKKHTIAFSIMINSFIDMPTKYKLLEDKICAAIVENS